MLRAWALSKRGADWPGRVKRGCAHIEHNMEEARRAVGVVVRSSIDHNARRRNDGIPRLCRSARTVRCLISRPFTVAALHFWPRASRFRDYTPNRL